MPSYLPHTNTVYFHYMKHMFFVDVKYIERKKLLIYKPPQISQLKGSSLVEILPYITRYFFFFI